MKKVHKKRLRQAISSILAAAMSLSLFTTIPASAEIGKKTYQYDGYSVDYNVTNEWDGAQTVELTVSNTGTDPILNWALKYDAEGEISNLWNADLYEQNGDEYVIKNVGWNFEIAPSQSVTYGYTLSGDNISMPKNFEIYSKRVDKAEGYDVQYNITKSWDVGVEGNIVITNTSAAPIEAWTLSFDSNFTIDNLWNGRVLENNGTSYTVAAEMWTNPVQPNSSMTIGFVGSKAADVEALLSNFRLTEVVIGEGMPVIPIDPPVDEIEITANAVYDEESGNISVSWTSNKQDGTFDVLMSEDGENFVSVVTVEGVSEFVYTPENDFETLYFKVVQNVGDQTAESNVVAVAKSMEDIAISAEATYDEESGVITISWNTNKDGGDFEIFMSKDGETYTSVGTVENKSEFSYTPEDDFETLYFKVKQTLGEKNAESNVSEVNFYIDWEDKTDTDNDGLTDVYEKYYFETDPTNPDTDDDGLPDGYEVYYLGTDPTKADTDDNGVLDGDEDFDKDGLSNLREYELGTDPNSADSDSDGLTDGEEVNKYNTDPLKVDTDDDGVTDKDEIDLGLDPTNASTDGIPDSERTFEQSVGADTENFASVNTDENPFKVSVDVTAAGVAANNLYADESGYAAFVSNEAILGITPEFFYNDKLKVEKITINFDIGNEYVANTNGKYVSVSDEFVGIKRFNVFKYFDDINMLLPIETFHDVANNRVYANVDEMGTYCLIDMEVWFEKLGIEPKAAEPQAMALSNDETSELKVSNDDNLDVVFVLYLSSPYFEHMKSELITTAEEIFNEAEERNISARLHFLAWTGDVYLNTSTGEYYAENLEDATAMINRSVAINTSTLYPSDYVLTKAISGIKNTVCGNLQENSKKYSFIVDAGCNPTCTTIHYGIQALQEQGFDFSFIYAPGNHNIANYNALSSNNSCYQFKLMPGRMMFSDFVIEHIFAEEEAIIIKSNDFERLPDDFGEISTTSTQDYDGDGVPDVEEIDWETIGKYTGASYSTRSTTTVFPKLKTLMAIKNSEMLSVNIDRLTHDIDRYSILVVDSDPIEEDTDKDGFSDKYESDNKSKYNLNKRFFNHTIIKDSTIDDTYCINSGYLPKADTYYENCKGISYLTHGVSEGSETVNIYDCDFEKRILTYSRATNSKAKYTITPESNSDYKINFSAIDQNNVSIKIQKKTFGLYFSYDEDNYTVSKRTLNDGSNITCIDVDAILKGGETYRIIIEGLEDKTNNLYANDNEYTLTIAQDNWVYAPYGGATYAECIAESYTRFGGYDYFLYDYSKLYFTRDNLKNLLRSKSFTWNDISEAEEGFERRFTSELTSKFFDDYDTLGISNKLTKSDKANIASIVFTYAGVIILTGGSSVPFWVGAVISSAGGVSTTISIIYDDMSCEKFKSSLFSAVNSNQNNYNLSFAKYKYRAKEDVFMFNELSWDMWNGKYINKYEGSTRTEVVVDIYPEVKDYHDFI